MAQQLDLQEQEQLDAIKAFWNQYGNLITWVLTIGLACFAAWQGYVRYAQSRSAAAGTLYADVEKAATGGDAARAGTVFADMQSRYGHPLGLSFLPAPVYTQQAGLMAAKVQAEKNQADAAARSLQWVVDNGSEQYAALARLRLAALLADQKKYDEALKQVDAIGLQSFATLAADRRGDILMAKGDREGAKKAWTTAWNGLEARSQYRVVVESKLAAIGAAPALPAADAAASGAAR